MNGVPVMIAAATRLRAAWLDQCVNGTCPDSLANGLAAVASTPMRCTLHSVQPCTTARSRSRSVRILKEKFCARTAAEP